MYFLKMSYELCNIKYCGERKYICGEVYLGIIYFTVSSSGKSRRQSEIRYIFLFVFKKC